MANKTGEYELERYHAKIRGYAGARTLEKNDTALDAADLMERFELLKEHLIILDRRIAQRRRMARSFKERLESSLAFVASSLESHRQTWNEVESNPSASSRRIFLEGQLIRLNEQLCTSELISLDKAIALEETRLRLLNDYIQLRRVAAGLH